jgi:periplasmic divalent cation tolerance protein
MSSADAVIVLTTLASEDEAATFVRALVERRLVACGTIVPATRSIYRWEDAVADEREALVVLKTRSGQLEALREAFATLHPYKVPELLALPVAAGLPRYLDWIAAETAAPTL